MDTYARRMGGDTGWEYCGSIRLRALQSTEMLDTFASPEMRVSWCQAQDMHTAVKNKGVLTSLVVYPGTVPAHARATLYPVQALRLQAGYNTHDTVSGTEEACAAETHNFRLPCLVLR